MPYSQDDLMWCIPRAKTIFKMFSLLLIISPSVWFILIFGIGYGSGVLLYIMVQFDRNYKQRNQRDWHYTVWLIMLPAVIGTNQRYQPQQLAFKIFYFVILFTSMLMWNEIFFEMIRYVKQPVYKWQFTTVAEVVKNRFKLAGSDEVLTLISTDDQVCYTLTSETLARRRRTRGRASI